MTYLYNALYDAKGDILVGVGDNQMSRRGVGLNGQVLIADSNEADGVNWKLPQNTLIPAVGDYIGTPHSNRTTVAPVADVTYTPIWLPIRMTFDRIGVEVTTADAGASVLLGVTDHNFTTNRPGTPVWAGATVSGATVQIAEATINETFGPGLFWLTSAPQTPGTLQLRHISTGAYFMPGSVNTRAFGATPGLGYRSSGAAAALPTNPTLNTTPLSPVTLICLRRSA